MEAIYVVKPYEYISKIWYTDKDRGRLTLLICFNNYTTNAFDDNQVRLCR